MGTLGLNGERRRSSLSSSASSSSSEKKKRRKNLPAAPPPSPLPPPPPAVVQYVDGLVEGVVRVALPEAAMFALQFQGQALFFFVFVFFCLFCFCFFPDEGFFLLYVCPEISRSGVGLCVCVGFFFVVCFKI
jgi:hypothetical protein